jgi:uncharacterized membrane protein
MRDSFLLTALLGIVFFVADRFYKPYWLHPYWSYLLLFYVMLSILLHRLMSFVKDPKSAQFTIFFMAFTTAKLILSLAFMGVMLYNSVPARKTFVLSFLGLYLVYTGFEIYSLTRKLRRDS